MKEIKPNDENIACIYSALLALKGRPDSVWASDPDYQQTFETFCKQAFGPRTTMHQLEQNK